MAGDLVHITWVQEATLRATGVTLGVADDGRWFVGNSSGAMEITDHAAGVRLLPFLEQEQIPALLADFSRARNTTANPDIAVERVIEAGLSSKRDYWASLSLDWLDRLGTRTFSAALLQELAAVAGAGWGSQRVRHRARALCRVLAAVTH